MECKSRNGNKSFCLVQTVLTQGSWANIPPSYDCLAWQGPFQNEHFPAELWPIKAKLRLGRRKTGNVMAKWKEGANRKGGQDRRLQWTKSVCGEGEQSWGYRCTSLPLTSYPLQTMVTCIYTATLGTKGIIKMPEICPISELTHFILQLQHVTLFYSRF